MRPPGAASYRDFFFLAFSLFLSFFLPLNRFTCYYINKPACQLLTSSFAIVSTDHQPGAMGAVPINPLPTGRPFTSTPLRTPCTGSAGGRACISRVTPNPTQETRYPFASPKLPHNWGKFRSRTDATTPPTSAGVEQEKKSRGPKGQVHGQGRRGNEVHSACTGISGLAPGIDQSALGSLAG